MPPKTSQDSFLAPAPTKIQHLATRIKCWPFDQPPQNCVMRGSGLRFAEDAEDMSVPSLYVICFSAMFSHFFRFVIVILLQPS
jgi:hypothetical protein